MGVWAERVHIQSWYKKLFSGNINWDTYQKIEHVSAENSRYGKSINRCFKKSTDLEMKLDCALKEQNGLHENHKSNM